MLVPLRPITLSVYAVSTVAAVGMPLSRCKDLILIPAYVTDPQSGYMPLQATCGKTHEASVVDLGHCVRNNVSPYAVPPPPPHPIFFIEAPTRNVVTDGSRVVFGCDSSEPTPSSAAQSESHRLPNVARGPSLTSCSSLFSLGAASATIVPTVPSPALSSPAGAERTTRSLARATTPSTTTRPASTSVRLPSSLPPFSAWTAANSFLWELCSRLCWVRSKQT